MPTRSKAQIAEGGAEPRRLLVRGVNWLGDAVMTTPALQRLRERFPAAHLALLTPAKLAPLWTAHPALDCVVVRAPGEGTWSVARRLGQEKFDTALVLPNSPRSALEMWLAGIPRRIGYARPWRNWFLTETVGPRPGRVATTKRSVSQVRRLAAAQVSAEPKAQAGIGSSSHAHGTEVHQANEYLHLAGVLGANPLPLPVRLVVTAEELKSARKRFGLDSEPDAQRPVLGLNPGAEYGPAKRWPAERFIAAARTVSEKTGCSWLLLGGANEREVAAVIEAGLRGAAAGFREPLVKNLAGKTELRELMALLNLCRVLLTNDTGPMHVAAALGTPVVVPFGSTSPQLTGPGFGTDSPHQILQAAAPCSPCFRRACPIDFRCMTGISVQAVADAVLRACAFQAQ